MSDIHTIRLKQPWQCESLADGSRWSRCFNWPAGVLPQETVWLVVEPLPEGATVQLNGRALVDPLDRPLARFDISALIADRNQVVIQLAGPSEEDQFPLRVRLEIDEG